MTTEEVVRRVIVRVAELPDRDSPDDWPEAMLVTDEELRRILTEELAAFVLQPVGELPVMDHLIERALEWADARYGGNPRTTAEALEVLAAEVRRIRSLTPQAVPTSEREAFEAWEKAEGMGENMLRRDNATGDYTARLTRSSVEPVICTCGSRNVDRGVAGRWCNACGKLFTQPPAPDSREADCARCFKEAGGVIRDRMILCPTCGNKRCPKATDHRLACTGSNEPGQESSAYATPKPEGETAKDLFRDRDG